MHAVPVSAVARLYYLHFCEIHPVLLSKDKQKLVCKLAIENEKYQEYASQWIHNFTTFIHSTGFGCFKGWKLFSDSMKLYPLNQLTMSSPSNMLNFFPKGMDWGKS